MISIILWAVQSNVCSLFSLDTLHKAAVMSLARSSVTLALLRSLSRSAAPQVSRICYDCLHSPASCQISSIVNAASSGHAVSSLRWQTTSSTSSVPIEGTPPPNTLSGDASSALAPSSAETATTSSSETSSSAVASSSQATLQPALPSLSDLDALKARKLRFPSEASPADSPEVGMYNRRFKRIAARVSKAFNKDQLAHLANLAKLDELNTKLTKTAMVNQLLTQYWGYIDPAEIVARDAERRKMEASTPKDIVEGKEALCCALAPAVHEPDLHVSHPQTYLSRRKNSSFCLAKGQPHNFFVDYRQ